MSSEPPKPEEPSFHPALEKLAEKFEPTPVTPQEASLPIPTLDYFNEISIEENLQSDQGVSQIIDVQCDERFVLNYIIYYVAKRYPDYTIKDHPTVSTLSIAGYCLDLFHAHLYMYDSTIRRPSSEYADALKSNSKYSDYINLLLNSAIPDFMQPLLSAFTDTHDPHRRKLHYIPSYAGYSFNHDFGRTMPSFIFYKAHDKLCAVKSAAEKQAVLDDFYHSNLIRLDAINYQIGNLLGTHYFHDANPFRHKSWVTKQFEIIFNPLISRASLHRTSLAEISITPYAATIAGFNPYIYVLGCTTRNLSILTATIKGLSAFFKGPGKSAVTLQQLLKGTRSSIILNHTVEPPTLPTHSFLTIRADQSYRETEYSEATDEEFATQHGFLTMPENGTLTCTAPSSANATLSLVGNKKYESEKASVTWETFDEESHVVPDVLYFAPYDANPASKTYTLALGLKIESGEIEGSILPLPNPDNALHVTNSHLLNSTVPLYSVNNSMNPNSPVYVQARPTQLLSTETYGYVRRTLAANVLPKLTLDNVISKNFSILQVEDHHVSIDQGTNVLMSSVTKNNIPKDSVYVWSSYRYTINNSSRLEKIHMFYSFVPIYGTSIPLNKSKSPVLLIPRH